MEAAPSVGLERRKMKVKLTAGRRLSNKLKLIGRKRRRGGRRKGIRELS